MALEYIWPGLWIVSLVPLLAFVTTFDGLTSSSVRLGHRLRIRAEWVLIAALLSILISLVLVLDLRLSSLAADLYGSLDRHSDRDPRIWVDRELLENWILLLDIVLVLCSLPIVGWMAFNRVALANSMADVERQRADEQIKALSLVKLQNRRLLELEARLADSERARVKISTQLEEGLIHAPLGEARELGPAVLRYLERMRFEQSAR